MFPAGSFIFSAIWTPLTIIIVERIERDESAINHGSDMIFTSAFSAYMGLGKDSLDVGSLSLTSETLEAGFIKKKKKKTGVIVRVGSP